MQMNLDILRMAQDLAAHSATRQAVIAENIAHADTPGYRAMDIPAFSETYNETSRDDLAMRATRSGHIVGEASVSAVRPVEASLGGAESPNGNNVSLEDQMVRSVDVKAKHDLALGIYAKSLSILRQGLGRQG